MNILNCRVNNLPVKDLDNMFFDAQGDLYIIDNSNAVIHFLKMEDIK